jgi:hypothetical protein
MHASFKFILLDLVPNWEKKEFNLKRITYRIDKIGFEGGEGVTSNVEVLRKSDPSC